MLKDTNEETSVLEDYLFSGLSFSTFKFDKASFLACKCYLTRFSFFKKRYYRLISTFLGKEEKVSSFVREKYFINQTIKALKDSSVLISSNKVETKLYSKIKEKKDIDVASSFRLVDLPIASNKKKACLVINNNEDKIKYGELINYYDEMDFIVLEEIKDDNLVYDQIKLKLLQDENDIYFVSENVYANYIVESIYSMNKVAVHL